MNNAFHDRVIAITGGAQGIGFATARLLLSRGARVSIGDLDDAALDAAEKDLYKQAGEGKVLVTQLNVADRKSVDTWIDKTLQWAGRLDGAVNVAGINGPEAGEKSLAETSDEHWNQVISVNLTGHFFSLRAELNALKDHSGASIVCVSSVQGCLGFAHTATYSASKHAIIGLVRSVAKEVGERGIRINTIAPGAIDTQMVAPKDRENIKTPIKRLGKPEECAALIAYLLSEDASFITGATYSIDGGWAC